MSQGAAPGRYIDELGQHVHPSVLVRWLYRRIPAVYSARRYSIEKFRGDLIAGLTVATVAVPQAMAYALVAGLPAEYGLYTAIVMTAVGAVFDSSKQLINGPTNAISIALLSAISVLPAESRLSAAILCAFLVGCIQVGITLLRLGDLTRYISHSVIIGFTLGAGALLPLDQMKNLLGLKAQGDPHDLFMVRFWETMTHGGHVHALTLEVGLASMALVLALRWAKGKLRMPLLPDLLLTVVIMAALSARFGFESAGVKVVGDIPAQLPRFAPPDFHSPHLRQLSTSALAIATLGLLEAISMAKAIAAQTRQRIDINQQCLSEGLANVTGSFFHCFPGSGSLTRSTINQQAGGQTQWSGVISAAAVAAIVMLFAPYAQFIPKSAMAGILIISSWKMVDWKALRFHLEVSRFDRLIIAATAFAAIGISVEFCVLIGVFMSFMLTVPRAGRMLLTEFVVDEDGIIVERGPDDTPCERILIFGLEGEMFFGAASRLDTLLATIENRITDETKILVLRVKRVRNPDAVGMHMLHEHLELLHQRGVKVILVGVRQELYGVFERAGIVDRLGADQIFLEQAVRQTSTQKGMAYAYQFLDEVCRTCPRPPHHTSGPKDFRYNV